MTESTLLQRSQSEMVVRKSITIQAPQAHVFSVFTEQFATWWPIKTHHIGSQDPVTAAIEPGVGGRCFERAADGTECVWGHVRVWNPPQRLVYSWEIDADWKPNPAMTAEVEVNFVAEGPEVTRVELEHRNLDAFGEKAAMMMAILGSDGGWTGLLRGFAAVAEKK